ncbi:MAG: methylenetetrahydrofolate--tRNA-(uracil(54)-C(5))-methyltransferase (FADH(2)-oxidizing) TrmFO [Pseudomonadota bacterium]|nr:methylenetetrahydrofolate--tRNA-(uracil(54)-C(5))-methyltransferase (FADH(2)-oxidizing) TrmFO [Pseudomonadota bacterium]
MADVDQTIHIIGGGLAGSEAAWQAAGAGARVILHEMRPELGTEAHLTGGLAELVCSNSFRSDDHTANAVGLLHEEMRRCDSLVMSCADANRVPAGGALAVDRAGFSYSVEAAIEAEPLITIQRGEVTQVPIDGAAVTIVATGPLTSTALAAAIQTLTGEEALAFFDAIAPIVHRDTINFDKAWFQSRYDKGSGRDYINCPLDEAQYATFVEALIAADTVSFHEWEATTPYFEGCLPIEVMAARGPETLAFGPMKPVGLTNLHAPDQKPKAVAQLRQDNALGTLYNIVGFQTKLRHGEQIRVLRMIPGLETADFARLGGLHRNTFINGPRLLGPRLHLKSAPRLMFAGQITGCEGYVESAAVGLLAGRFAASDIYGPPLAPPPPVTALGALLAHITGGGDAASYQPMNVNFGLFPPIEQSNISAQQKKLNIDKRLRGKTRKTALSARALKAIDYWLAENSTGDRTLT